MFKWLINAVDNARIAVSYPGYERQCRRIWEEDAETKYSTTSIEDEIKSRMRKSMAHVARAFGKPIRELESKRKGIRGVVSEAEEKLAIINRNYKAELDDAYKELNDTREELEECKKNLSDAFDHLEEAKSNLDSWYAQAEGRWFGNAGKQLPQNAFFGQDLSDRDHYKDERDSAGQEIGHYKAERAKIGSHIGELKAGITRIKQERQKMFDLKKAGFDKRIVTSAISNGKTEICAIDKEISGIEKLRDDYIDKAKISLGVYELEKKIDRLKREKDAYIESFDSDSAVHERKRIHRVEWMAARGKFNY
jgi:chromosome segregation ATPase